MQFPQTGTSRLFGPAGAPYGLVTAIEPVCIVKFVLILADRPGCTCIGSLLKVYMRRHIESCD